MRDYDKPLTIVLTGSGVSRKPNSQALLEDFIFGNLPGDAQVDVKFIVPYASRIKPGLTDAIDVLKDWGIDSADFTPVVEPDCGHPSVTSAAKTVQVDQGDSMLKCIELLDAAHSEGRNTAFISIYDPVSTVDLEDISYAKGFEWLTTLNLAEGLIDAFEGYESAEDREARKMLQDAFDEQQATKSEVPKPPRKTAAKKATTPRKRAASKTLVQEDTPLVDAPEKPLVEPHKHTYIWVDDNKGMCGSFCTCGEEEPNAANCSCGGQTLLQVHTKEKCYDKPAANLIAKAVAREENKKAAREYIVGDTVEVGGIEFTKIAEPSTELSGTIAMASQLPKDLEPVTVQDIQTDIAKAAPSMGDSVVVAKSDIVQLGNAMQKMAEGFSEAITVYKKIVESN